MNESNDTSSAKPPTLSEIERLQLTAGLDFGARARSAAQAEAGRKKVLAMVAGGLFFVVLVFSPDLPGLVVRFMQGLQ